MDYRESLHYLQRLGDEVLTMKFGLSTMRSLLEELGDPHRRYPTVLIAGTNGKGSVARFLGSILHAEGIRCGLYTSPHLVRLEERFRVDGESIQESDFARCLSQVVRAVKTLALPCHPTHFETLTGLAFLYFAQKSVRIAIMEIGMGGRLDSTNVADPILSILTSIGYDHQQYLGSSLAEISREKAGILRPRTPAVLAPQILEVHSLLLSAAMSVGTPLHCVDRKDLSLCGSDEGRYKFRFRNQRFQLQVLGRHQVENAATAVLAGEILRNHGYELSQESLFEGLARTRHPGILQKVGEAPLFILDGAHNLDAAKRLADFLQEHTEAPRCLLFGMMQDKDYEGVLSILAPHFERVYLTELRSARTARVADLKRIVPKARTAREPDLTYQLAREWGARTVVVTGSLYLVGDILSTLSVPTSPF